MNQRLLNETVEPGMAVLVAAPSLTPEPDALCADLLAGPDPSQQRVLLVTLLHKPEARLRIWKHNGGDSAPQAMAILTPSESSRSRGRRGDEAVALPDQTRIERVSIPPDLTDIGLKLTDITTDWADEDGQVVVCFHSLSLLLQYAADEHVFRFFTVLLNKLEAIDAVAHVHVDPGVHDDVTLAKFAGLFDAIFQVTDDGEWTVRSR